MGEEATSEGGVTASLAGTSSDGSHLDYLADSLAVLDTMLDDPQLTALCDVVTVVDGVRFPAHRAVLAAASPVFKEMFIIAATERDAREVLLDSTLDAPSWRMVLQYLYKTQVDIADEHSALLLSGARKYQLKSLESFVEKFLVSRLSDANCCELLAHAEHHDLDELKREAMATIEEHFEMVALSPTFLQCQHALIDELLASPNLVVRSEMQVFNAVARWVAHTQDENDNGANNEGKELSRKEYAERLLRHIDLMRLSEEQLKVVVRHTMTRSCPKFFESALERALCCRPDAVGESLLASGCPKAHKRCERVYTFAFKQRGMKMNSRYDNKEVITPSAHDDEEVALASTKNDDEKVVRTPSPHDDEKAVRTPPAHDDEKVVSTPPAHDVEKEMRAALAAHDDWKEAFSPVTPSAHNDKKVVRPSVNIEEEVVRTPWAHDETGRIVWRLKIYPGGYNRAKGLYLSMYLQARSAVESEKLDLSARFDIFLVNRKDGAATISMSSKHHFNEYSDHWGFHRFLPIAQIHDAGAGFIDVESDSLLVGANIYY